MCAITPPARCDFPVDQRSSRHARYFLRAASCPAHQSRVLDQAQLLATELVTNAVRHGGPPVRVEVACDGSKGMTVRVSDGSEAGPVLRNAGDTDESGRGVMLVDMLSDDWGVDRSAGDGKAVWFVLRPSADRPRRPA